MQYRTLGKTGYSVSAISFGAWAIGGSWGDVSDDTSLAALRKFVELGGNFIDTADVYGDGRSERLISQVLKEHPGRLKVATKAGRRLDPHVAEGYTPANIEAFVDRSLKNLEVESLDLVQLHCPPTPVYGNSALFAGLHDIQQKGKVRHWGVSVETIAEAMEAIQYDNVCTVQLIFNVFRQRPADTFFDAAKQRNVGILARVPLASGLLTGKFKPGQQFAQDDHRNFNQTGQAFDAGETFSGLGDHLDDAYAAVEELKKIVPPGQTLTQFALRWILMHDAVTCAIPGAKDADQAAANVAAAALPPLTAEQMTAIRGVYDRYIKAHVDGRW
ncbi:MAG TPA: aldo/keto reductase [Tepidisphaeraceae bacterium]|jgi:aryl-alcohol dehydrogenase-like predicted oxidoreductase